MKVIILDENAREDLLDRFREDAPKVKDNGPGLKAKPFECFEELHHLPPDLVRVLVGKPIFEVVAKRSRAAFSLFHPLAP